VHNQPFYRHPWPEGLNRSPQWRADRLLWAPHRLGFAAACVVLVASSLWWLWVQATRMGWLPVPPMAVSPTITHATLMVYGFMPLFFSGFLFTAGPKWLGVQAPAARQLAGATLAQVAGWLLVIPGSLWHINIMLAGMALAWVGLSCNVLRFAALLRQADADDKTHARIIVMAGALGSVALAATGITLALGRLDLSTPWLLTGLWGYVGATYVTAAHRLIPFFTSSALPMVTVWRPMWALYFLLLAVVQKVLLVWLEWGGWSPNGLQLLGNFWLAVSGLVMLWLAFMWGLTQSMSIRLLAMLHIGFVWLGLAFLIEAVGQFWALLSRSAPWTLGALHATTIGFMGSLMLAMVTRVSCGHGGRKLVADDLTWMLFGLLQLAAMSRVAAALLAGHPELANALTILSAILWNACVLPWSLRLLNWYGRPRADGRPG
jgi:uncharacterized protein involved in response to NO